MGSFTCGARTQTDSLALEKVTKHVSYLNCFDWLLRVIDFISWWVAGLSLGIHIKLGNFYLNPWTLTILTYTPLLHYWIHTPLQLSTKVQTWMALHKLVKSQLPIQPHQNLEPLPSTRLLVRIFFDVSFTSNDGGMVWKGSLRLGSWSESSTSEEWRW